MYTLGLSCCFDHTEENFCSLQKHGIGAVEVTLRNERNDQTDYKNLLALSKKYDVDLWSMHLPYCTIDISAGDAVKLHETVSYVAEFIKKGADIGIDKFVMHPSVEPIEQEEREEHKKKAMDSLNKLAEVADSAGGVLCVENLPRTCLCNTTEETAEIISVNDKLKVCFDTNHLLNNDSVNFMKTFADKIVTIHVSDYDFVNERHWLPGEGKADWEAIMKTFSEIDYKGVFMYEVNLKSPKSIVRDRDLTFADYVENAKQLFSGKTPAPFGKPLPNLGMWA